MARFLALILVICSCAQLRDELRHAETDFDQARYEDALIWLKDLESDVGEMSPDMQTRFYFLRGMTAYRLGRRDDALHYLALSREVAGEQGTGLRSEWRSQLEDLLEELTPVGPTWHARPAQTDEDSALNDERPE